MRWRHHLPAIVAVAGMALALSAVAQTADPPEAATPPAPRLAEPAPAADTEPVAMIAFTVGSRILEGRLLAEDDEWLRIQMLDGHPIGFAKADVKDIRRTALPAGQYHEQVGDYLAERAAKAEAQPDDYSRARVAYRKSLYLAQSDTVRQKLDGLAAERQERHQEELRRKEIQEADARIEVARLEKEAIQKRIEDSEAMADTMRELEERAAEAIKQQGRAMARALDEHQRVARRLALRLQDSDQTVHRLRTTLAGHGRQLDNLRREHGRIRRTLEKLEDEDNDDRQSDRRRRRNGGED